MQGERGPAGPNGEKGELVRQLKAPPFLSMILKSCHFQPMISVNTISAISNNKQKKKGIKIIPA